MRVSKFFLVGVVSFFTLPWLLALSAGTAHAQKVRWQQMFGIQEAGNVVGVGTGQVTGGAPWEITGGSALVDLKTGKVRFQFGGLVLAVGSVPAFKLAGLDIGTPAGVTQVKGTLVCDVDGSAGGANGNSVLVDTPAVTLNAQGNAQFNGNVGPLPAVCGSESDIAFLIRIVQPPAFADVWIAAGAVRVP